MRICNACNFPPLPHPSSFHENLPIQFSALSIAQLLTLVDRQVAGWLGSLLAAMSAYEISNNVINNILLVLVDRRRKNRYK